MKTNKTKTMEVFAGSFCENGDLNNININYLNDTLQIEIENNYNLYMDIVSNKRRKIRSIVWDGLLKSINDRLSWEYGSKYYCTSQQLKSIIKENYSILNDTYEYFEEMRKDALEEN